MEEEEEVFDPETELIQPERDELSYRRGLLNSRKTMAFHHGTIAFPQEQWDDFLNNHVHADPKKEFYRYIYCVDCGYFVGEAGWEYDDALQGYVIKLLVSYDNRESTYGTKALALLQNDAVKNNIHTFYLFLDKDNPYRQFFEKRGFSIMKEEDERILLKKEF